MADNVVEIPGHKPHWSPAEALAVASRQPWDQVVIVGHIQGELSMFGSDLTREEMLWLGEQLRMLALTYSPD